MREETSEGTVLNHLGKDFGYLLEHTDEWEDGEIQPGDLPKFDRDIQSVIIYSVLFGTLWELAHPSIYAVMDGEKLVGLYGHKENAEERAEELGCRVQRMSVADGDEDPEEIIDMAGVA